MKYKVAVIGAGVVGLTSAVRIQEEFGQQVDVTIYTAEKSPKTTGDVSAGFWAPYLLKDTQIEKVIQWGKETKEYFLKLWREGLAEECGISLIPVVRINPDINDEPVWSNIAMGYQLFTKEQIKKYSKDHNCNYIGGYHFVTITCEPSCLLPYLEKQFINNKGVVKMKKIESYSELKDYDIIVNCTGLNARQLNDDSNMTAIRGQITRVEAPWQFHIVFNDCDNGNYIIPNKHCVILGGTHQEKVEDLNPRKSDTDFISNGCEKMEPSLKNAVILQHQVGLRPGRSAINLGLDMKMIDGKIIPIVQNYGHGGSGVTLCYGCAGEATQVVGEALKFVRKSKL